MVINSIENEALDRIAWFCYNSHNRSHSVGEKEPNNWGLYDVMGNVWEAVEEEYSNDYSRIGDSLLKGGAWNDLSIKCISGKRIWDIILTNTQGFRIVRDLKEYNLKRAKNRKGSKSYLNI